MKYILSLLVLVSVAGYGQTDTLQLKVLSSNTVSVKSEPCKVDTLRGILIWHNDRDYTNYGNSWDYGYWIGLCSPMAMPLKDIVFIPGQMKITQRITNTKTNKTVMEHSETQSGAFYDADFKKIPSKNVYALVIIREKESALKGF